MKMISAITRTIATRVGHAIDFIAGEETHVPGPAVAECLALGCAPVDGEAPAVEPVLSSEPQGEEREQIVIEAMKAIVIRNTREDFGANGAPTPAAVSTVCGFPVSSVERDQMWVKAQAGDD